MEENGPNPKIEQQPSPDAASERPKSPEEQRGERLQRVTEELAALPAADAANSVDDVRKEKERELETRLQTIEPVLGTISEESRAMMYASNVEDSVAAASKAAERRNGLIEERDTLANEQVIEESLSDIMTFSEYRERGAHPTPYTFELKKGGKEIRYFGSAHSEDPADPMFDTLKASFEGFAAENAGKDAVVFFEGGDLQTAGLSEEEAKGNGEMAYTKLLAERAGVEVRSAEPPEKELISAVLEKGFSKEELATWYLLRNAKAVTNIQKKPMTYFDIGREMIDIEENVGVGWIKDFPGREAIVGLLRNDPAKAKKYAEDVGRAVAPIFLESFKKMNGVDLTKTGPTESPDDIGVDPDIAEKYVDPADLSHVGSKTNEIGAINNRERDLAVTRTIAKEFAQGKNVFVTFGASHAVMQEPALRKIVNETA